MVCWLEARKRSGLVKKNTQCPPLMKKILKLREAEHLKYG